ncbi:uncharacterized protein SGFS_078930 [Streptomyces graminofaciens]|uniref:Uncharacterized protein n=1 Tax=Streptomyces graminofaciens TaxID=68212 RepID=A0ABM7FHM9_9ACTN|nr:hypothetical protein [Streptomyces graminofaciens]BBC36599.1 uncharacterized protein SGFS_078930 [Streptomyces graminofaciens]
MHALFDPSEPRRVSPGEYPMWDRALALLNRDLAVTLPEQEPLQLLALPSGDADEPENVYVALANGEWHGNYLDPDSPDDPASALAIVADAAQETLTELLWQAWPVCAEHGLGMHPRDTDGQLAWWCAGERLRPGPAHIRAAVGALDTFVAHVAPA